jgi:hypothetical protein
MNFGANFTGVTFFMAAAVLGANNGLSVDPATTKAVLGNDSGDIAQPAGLISNREISLLGAMIDLVDQAVGTQNRIRIQSNNMRMDEIPTGNVIQWQCSPGLMQQQINSLVAGVAATLQLSSPNGSIGMQTENSTNISISDTIKSWVLQLLLGVMHIRDNNGAGNGLILDPVSNDVASTGTLSTADPGSGSGTWKLGDVVVAASALDATQYIEVLISGVPYRLALVT